MWLVGEIPSVPALTPIGSCGVYRGEMTEMGLRGAGLGGRGGVVTSRLRRRGRGFTLNPVGGSGGWDRGSGGGCRLQSGLARNGVHRGEREGERKERSHREMRE